MNIINKLVINRIPLIVALALIFIFSQNDLMGQNGSWTAPKSADTYKNPFSGNEKATAAGKKLYTQLCAICHGNKGKGDGLAGMALKPRPSDFTKASVQGQTDGAIYWKITEGRAPMASYKGSLTNDQRWQLVNFLRSLKK